MFLKKYKQRLAEENRKKLKRGLELIAKYIETDVGELKEQLNIIDAKLNTLINRIKKGG